MLIRVFGGLGGLKGPEAVLRGRADKTILVLDGELRQQRLVGQLRHGVRADGRILILDYCCPVVGS